jgi:hypothetical protein
MSLKLLVDPESGRVLYVAHNGVLPERLMILHNGRQHLFQLSSCEVVEFDGPLPESITLENAWGYRYSPDGLVLIEEPAPRLEKVA